MSFLKNVETAKDWNKKQIAEALYWMILGDGSLPNWKKYRDKNYTCYLSVQHRPEHHDYLCWKGMILSRIKIGWDITENDRRHEGKGVMLTLNSKSHPFFNTIADRLYIPIGHKRLDTHALALLDNIGLAIWYQDDGSYNVRDGLARITADSFGSVEILAIAKTLVDRFGLIFRLQRHVKGFDLALRKKDNSKFFSLISPYVVPSMQYKLGRCSKT